MSNIPMREDGGRLFHHSETGVAGCPTCGWSGAPIIEHGVPLDLCPRCDLEYDGEGDWLKNWKPWESAPFVAAALKRIRRSKAKAVGRNAPCPCGSGKKYKKCCMD